jgi:hypothetical protein
LVVLWGQRLTSQCLQADLGFPVRQPPLALQSQAHRLLHRRELKYNVSNLCLIDFAST